MAKKSGNYLFDILRLLLKPTVKFCLKNNLKLQEFTELSKTAFLEVAGEEIKKHKADLSASKLNAMTGVHRRDIARFKESEQQPKSVDNALVRIIGQWQHDSNFLSPSGRPRSLTFEGKDNEFIKLVRCVSKDLNPYSILFEIERIGAVEKKGDKLFLKTKAYSPKNNKTEAYQLLAEDTQDLSSAVIENIETVDGQVPNLHVRTFYDNIQVKDLPKIKTWLLEKGNEFHQEASKYLSNFDQDINPADKPEDRRCKVSISSYSFTEELIQDKAKTVKNNKKRND